jgi:hypothetical protein
MTLRQRRHARSIGTLRTACCLAILGAGITAEILAQTPQTYTGILTTRPAPDLATIAERSAPDHAPVTDATESFWDLLKLRDTATADAIPAMKQVLVAHRDSSRIHRFASAQALFSIGTPEALAILDQELLTPAYDARLGIMYAFHWEMRPALRDEFIRRYHLKNLAADLAVTVSAGPMQGDELPITVALANRAQQPISLPDSCVDEGSIYFEAPDGRIALTRQSHREHMGRKWITLQPAEEHSTMFTLKLKTRTPADRLELPSPPNEEQQYLESSGMRFMIGRSGTFKVRALVYAPPITDLVRATLRAPAGVLWTGRAVSEPRDVSIIAPE